MAMGTTYYLLVRGQPQPAVSELNFKIIVGILPERAKNNINFYSDIQAKWTELEGKAAPKFFCLDR